MLKEILQMALTTEQIHATADSLSEQGSKPTLLNVRKALGGGSYTTISDAMRTWRQEQQHEQKLQEVAIPDIVNEKAQFLIATVWQQATSVADERLTAERKALKIAKEDAQDKVNQLLDAVKNLEDEKNDNLKELDLLTEQVDRTESRAALATANLEKVTAQSKVEIDTLKQQLVETQHNLNLQAQQIKASEQNVSNYSEKLSVQQAENKSISEQLATVVTQNISKDENIERLKSEIAESKALLEKKDVKFEEIIEERNALNIELATKAGRLDTTLEQIATLTVECKQLIESNKELSVNVSKLTVERDALINSVKDLENKKQDK